MTSNGDLLTPLRRQYLDIKKLYADCLLLIRIGDFYEAFDDDAAILARELDIVLTSKAMGRVGRVPLAGVPHHSLDRHLATLINRGFRIAICEQLTEPGKGLIERGVTRVVTPGTILEPALLHTKANNYLAAACFEGKRAGLAYADVSTGEFAATEIETAQLIPELQRIAAAEILVNQHAAPQGIETLTPHATLTNLDAEDFDSREAAKLLLRHFDARTLAAFGLQNKSLATAAAAAIINYLQRTQFYAAENLTRLNVYDVASFMMLDAQTLRSLDVFDSNFVATSKQKQSATATAAATTLIDLLDDTRTAMGGRFLRRALRRPLLNRAEIMRRQDFVLWLIEHADVRGEMRDLLDTVHDLERLASRTRSGLATANELWTLGQSLKTLPAIRALLQRDVKTFGSLLVALPDCAEAAELIERGLAADLNAKAQIRIREGFSPELDGLRCVLRDGKHTLAEMETRERARTGIKSLRVGYNKIFGYYIEITKPNLPLAPADYTRKQTLTNAERFITLELKEHETLVTNARERIDELEASLFRHLCVQISKYRAQINGAAETIALLDCLQAFAEISAKYDYVRPFITQTGVLKLTANRHPIIEHRLTNDERGSVDFVANDVELGGKNAPQIMLLTGPNMSGKSTFMRGVALAVLMAQTGCFVAAKEASLSLCDRIWTRTGLYDRIGSGESTFMTEMIETAEILHGATPDSLILLDELGRGTATYDGLAVARAVLEYIHNHTQLQAKTLFATHYHELTVLEEILARVGNYHVAIEERDGEIEFLHKIERGTAEKSYGIHAARLAGLPKPVIHRAQELLNELENPAHQNVTDARRRFKPRGDETSFINESVSSEHNVPLTQDLINRLLETILAANPDELSPIEALTKLYELQRLIKAETQKAKVEKPNELKLKVKKL